MVSLATSVGGIELDSCIYNASGPRTNSVEMLVKIGESNSGAVLSKSATLLKQTGNPMPRFVKEVGLGEDKCHGSMNSEGLPNMGIDYYIAEEHVLRIREASAYRKPYFVSLSGLSLNDNLEMLNRACLVDGVEAIELNLACPNVPGKPVIAYDFDQMDDVLAAVTASKVFRKSGKKLGVKLAPYFDMPHFKRAAEIVNSYKKFISFVVCINTIGNALIVDVENEMSAIAPKGGYGGLGGGFVKHTALANVRKLYELVDSSIDIIGVGGVSSGSDAFELILCGAKAVQIGTKHWTEGAACFERVGNELKTLMIEKGYSTIEEFRGKLKPFARAGRKKSRKSTTAVGASGPTAGGNYSFPVLAYAILVTLYLAAKELGMLTKV